MLRFEHRVTQGFEDNKARAAGNLRLAEQSQLGQQLRLALGGRDRRKLGEERLRCVGTGYFE